MASKSSEARSVDMRIAIMKYCHTTHTGIKVDEYHLSTKTYGEPIASVKQRMCNTAFEKASKLFAGATVWADPIALEITYENGETEAVNMERGAIEYVEEVANNVIENPVPESLKVLLVLGDEVVFSKDGRKKQ